MYKNKKINTLTTLQKNPMKLKSWKYFSLKSSYYQFLFNFILFLWLSLWKSSHTWQEKKICPRAKFLDLNFFLILDRDKKKFMKRVCYVLDVLELSFVIHYKWTKGSCWLCSYSWHVSHFPNLPPKMGFFLLLFLKKNNNNFTS